MSVVDAELQERCQVSPIRPIPKGWDEKTLLDAVGMKKDLIVAGPFGSNLKVSDYRNEGIPIIRLQNIDYGKFIDKEIKYISPEKARELAYHSFRAGDLVLAKLGDPIGKTCKVPDYFKDGIVVADVVRIRVENGWADTKFIMYSLNSVAAKKQLINGKIGSTRPRVNLDQIRGIRILVPPLNQQRKIAAILSSVDAAIEQTDAIIAQTERMKMGLMQELISGENETQKVKHIVLNKKGSIKIGPFGSQLKLSDMVAEGIKVYGQENIIKKDLTLGRRFISLEKYKTLKSCTIFPGDLVITMMGTIGKSMIFPETFEKGIMDSHLLRLQLDSTIVNASYLAHIFENYKNIKDQIYSLSQGGIMSGLSSSIIRELYIPLPPILKQNKLVLILSTIDDKLLSEKKYREHQGVIRQGLMQDLLTGRVRVKVDGHA